MVLDAVRKKGAVVESLVVHHLGCGIHFSEVGVYAPNINRYLKLKGAYAPTKKGKEKYPDEPIGYYTANGLNWKTPCTCKEECSFSCRGECGCSACSEAYQDFGYC